MNIFWAHEPPLPPVPGRTSCTGTAGCKTSVLFSMQFPWAQLAGAGADELQLQSSLVDSLSSKSLRQNQGPRAQLWVCVAHTHIRLRSTMSLARIARVHCGHQARQGACYFLHGPASDCLRRRCTTEDTMNLRPTQGVTDYFQPSCVHRQGSTRGNGDEVQNLRDKGDRKRF